MNAGVKMLDMAKKEKPKTPKQDPVSLFVEIPVKLGEALEAARKQSRRSKTAEVQIALEEHVKKLGLWSED